MAVSQVSKRYAKAIFELAMDHNVLDKVFADLRSLDKTFKDKEINEFLKSPLIGLQDRVSFLTKALDGKGLAKETHDFVLLLAKRNRLGIFHDLVEAFQSEMDQANNVSRGTVRSATALMPADRERIEKTVEKALNKKVIMTYEVDPSVIGGLVAQVGSYTFDDSITAHLQRMNEELKRRTV